MTRKQDYIVAWMELKGQRFEILVRPDLAFRYKEKGDVDIEDVLWTDTIYKDVRRGLKARPESVKKAFGTDNIRVVAQRILKEGEIQITEEQRRKMLEAKKKQIITYIARNAIDPTTGSPIPEPRIEAALEEVRFPVNLWKDAESQAVEAVRLIARVMPIRLARALIEVTIPPQYSGRAYQALMRIGDVKKTDWLPDGSLKAEIEVPAGAQIEVTNKIQALARGSADVKVKKVA